jgi:hypothetical protein
VDAMPGNSAIGEKRRALQLLARSPTGCTETLMLAHGFSAEVLGQLAIDGFASVEHGVMIAGQRQLMVRWIEITDLGQFVISDQFNQRSPSDPPR